MWLRRSFLLALSAFATLTLTACDSPNSIEGTLSLDSSLLVVSPGGNKKVLAPGSYRATIRAQQKGAQVFIDGNRATFKLPAFDKNASSIRISASQMGQAFGLSGRAYNTTEPFDRRVEVGCVYDTRSEYVCHRDSTGERVCDWETVTIDGRQTVEERGYSTDRHFEIAVVNTAGQGIGSFNAVKSLGETIQHRELIGGCDRLGGFYNY